MFTSFDRLHDFKILPPIIQPSFVRGLLKTNVMDREEVQKRLDELGFEWPSNEGELIAFNEAFKDYPHKTDEMKIDPIKIIKNNK